MLMSFASLSSHLYISLSIFRFCPALIAYYQLQHLLFVDGKDFDLTCFSRALDHFQFKQDTVQE